MNFINNFSIAMQNVTNILIEFFYIQFVSIKHFYWISLKKKLYAGWIADSRAKPYVGWAEKSVCVHYVGQTYWPVFCGSNAVGPMRDEPAHIVISKCNNQERLTNIELDVKDQIINGLGQSITSFRDYLGQELCFVNIIL